MSIMNFTVEETNLIAIYKASTKAVTLARIAAALSYMDIEMRMIAESASRKLAALSGSEFTAAAFTPVDEDEV